MGLSVLAMLSGCASTSSSSASPADVAFYGGAIEVGPSGGQSTLPLAKIDEVKQVTGVKAAFPIYRFSAKTGALEPSGIARSDFIVASDPTEAAWSALRTDYAQGHAIDADSSGEVVLGSGIAKELGKKTGDAVSLPLDAAAVAPGRSFTVVGVLRGTGTAPDSTAFINLADGQALLAGALPAAERDQLQAGAVATGIDVYAKAGTSIQELDKLADQINSQVTGVVATRPSQLLDSLKGSR